VANGELSVAAGVSSTHLAQRFKEVVGVTPKRLARTHLFAPATARKPGGDQQLLAPPVLVLDPGGVAPPGPVWRIQSFDHDAFQALLGRRPRQFRDLAGKGFRRLLGRAIKRHGFEQPSSLRVGQIAYGPPV
jgi:AraC-like DNA-binding protein